MKGLRVCTIFFVFVYGKFFSTLQIVVKLFEGLKQMNATMLQISNILIDVKKALVFDEGGGEAVKNVPPHVQKYHFKTNVSYTLHVFQ